jgi:tripartite-type tricarboxylate transporter receptor subunit TctC
MPFQAVAASYPSAPITMILPLPAGGVLDVVAQGANAAALTAQLNRAV